MDVSNPIKSVIPSLDAAVLGVLAGTTHPLTGRQVHRLAGVGSDRGIRLVLNRLVKHGLATAEDQGPSTLYVANRTHLAWPAIESLVGLRSALVDEITERISRWAEPSLHASMFGSAARGDGDEDSDIDLLLVRRDSADEDGWGGQVSALCDWVAGATGNRCQVFDVTESRFAEHVASSDPLVVAWRREGILLAGTPIETMVRGAMGGSKWSSPARA